MLLVLLLSFSAVFFSYIIVFDYLWISKHDDYDADDDGDDERGGNRGKSHFETLRRFGDLVRYTYTISSDSWTCAFGVLRKLSIQICATSLLTEKMNVCRFRENAYMPMHTVAKHPSQFEAICLLRHTARLLCCKQFCHAYRFDMAGWYVDHVQSSTQVPNQEQFFPRKCQRFGGNK